MRITAVTLDLWGTLIIDGGGQAEPRNQQRAQSVQAVLKGAGEDFTEDQVGGAVDFVRDAANADHARGEDRTFADRVVQMLEALDAGLSARLPPEVIMATGEAVDRAFTDHPPPLADGALEVCESLAAMGLPLGMISNSGFTSGEAFRRFFKDTGLGDRFSAITISGDHATAKPTARMFSMTLDALGVEAGSTLHVGDALHNDVAGAHRAGMRTCWISGLDPSAPEVLPDLTIATIAELPEAIRPYLG